METVELIDKQALLSKIYEHPEVDGDKGLIRVLCLIREAKPIKCIDTCPNCGMIFLREKILEENSF